MKSRCGEALARTQSSFSFYSLSLSLSRFLGVLACQQLLLESRVTTSVRRERSSSQRIPSHLYTHIYNVCDDGGRRVRRIHTFVFDLETRYNTCNFSFLRSPASSRSTGDFFFLFSFFIFWLWWFLFCFCCCWKNSRCGSLPWLPRLCNANIARQLYFIYTPSLPCIMHVWYTEMRITKEGRRL